ncbi:MAG: class B sortase [Firmicutes bacterium]|nr:class B sortase [Bacillota bacterium]
MPTEETKETKEKKKKGGVGAWIYRIIILALVGVMGFSGYNIYKIYHEYEVGKVIYDDLAEDVGAGKKTGTDNTRLHLDWDKLKETNKDVCAWIRCKDTQLNYPIVEGKAWPDRDRFHDYYLARTITGEWNGKGTIFCDYLCEDPFNEFLTITYGHRMKDGSMYKMIVEYFGDSGIDFYEKHPTMELYTQARNYDIEIFACARVYSGDMEIYKFDFVDANGDEDPAQKDAYIRRVLSINELKADTGLTVTASDKLILMSTCTTNLDENRDVVWGRLVPVD